MLLEELSSHLSLSPEAQLRTPRGSEHFQASQQPHHPLGNLWGDGCLSQMLAVSAGGCWKITDRTTAVKDTARTWSQSISLKRSLCRGERAWQKRSSIWKIPLLRTDGVCFSECPDLGRATLPLGEGPPGPSAVPADQGNKEKNRDLGWV